MVRFFAWGFASGAVAVVVSACTLASPTHIVVEPSDDTAAGDGGTKPASASADPSGAGGAQCSGTFVKADVSKLKACGNGKGHCYDKTMVPGAANFQPCPDASQVCVQDEILESGGGKLKSCTSVIGAGGCMNVDLLIVPDEMKANVKLLKQDVCASGELCLPCADPTHGNAPTPFCEPMGVFDKPCSGSGPAAAGGDGGGGGGAAPAASAGCCMEKGKAKGMCIPEAAIPAAQKDQVGPDSCSSGNMCVPTALIPPSTPQKCSGLLGGGVCMDKCFNTLLGIANAIGIGSGDGCADDSEVCISCLVLSGKGMPGCE
jgi:hypothetical protein